MKAADLREKDIPELNKQVMNLLREQFNLRIQHSTGQLAQTHQLNRVRRDIARTRTILREKEGAAA